MLVHELLSRSLALSRLDGPALAKEQTTRLVQALQPAPSITFNGALETRDKKVLGGPRDKQRPLAHPLGVNALVVDRFEGRYLLSGGADSSISIWDLEQADVVSLKKEEEDEAIVSPSALLHNPLDTVSKYKGPGHHKFGITSLSFYPFDSGAFLSSSHDQSLKVYSTETLQPSASFDLSSNVYSHSISRIAPHLLVACATQHPAVRIVDLRSGAATHSLSGHGGNAVLSVAWSTRHEHVLASGGTASVVRLWDIRKASASLGVLDMDDSIGVVGFDGQGTYARRPERGHAHEGPVNGIVWTDDARHIVTTGHDEKIRVWDTWSGKNTLASFGPIVRNRLNSALYPCLVPQHLLHRSQDCLLFPNEGEILVYEMLEGKLMKRLRAPGTQFGVVKGESGSRANRCTALAWRHQEIELFSAHGDGTIRAWRPRTKLDAFVEREEIVDENENDTSGSSHQKRKRQVLENIEKELTRPRVTFT